MYPVPATHLRALAVLCERLPLGEVNWALTGSLGHRLQGVDVEVHDIDVQTDDAGAWIAAERLDEFLLGGPQLRESERMRSIFGTLRVHGVPVELMGGICKRPDPTHPWGPPTDPAEHRVLVRSGGLAVPVLSLAYEARAYEQIGRPERAAALRAALSGVEPTGGHSG